MDAARRRLYVRTFCPEILVIQLLEHVAGALVEGLTSTCTTPARKGIAAGWREETALVVDNDGTAGSPRRKIPTNGAPDSEGCPQTALQDDSEPIREPSCGCGLGVTCRGLVSGTSITGGIRAINERTRRYSAVRRCVEARTTPSGGCGWRPHRRTEAEAGCQRRPIGALGQRDRKRGHAPAAGRGRHLQDEQRLAARRSRSSLRQVVRIRWAP